MKKIFTILLSVIGQVALGQTNIAVPSYASASNTFNSYTGNIKFYLNGTPQTFTVGRGVNGICFFGSDMFVAFDDGQGTKGILWYANVSFSSGTFSSTAPVLLSTGQGTFSVTADASGNVYCANNDGTVIKFIRTSNAYSTANMASTQFWNTSQFADASGVFVDDATQTLWAVSYANNQAAVMKLNEFGDAAKVKKFDAYYSGNPTSVIQKPEGIAKDASGNIWIGNNNNNYVVRINNATVTSLVNALNAANYSFVNLTTATQFNDFAVSASGHQLGGLVYDNLYSSKMYVNDQVSGGNSFIYSFTANNSNPTFAATAMTQIYPGAGQCAIIPCALLPTPSNPTSVSANPSTVNPGQGSTLTATGCAADQTYLWKQGATTVSTLASFGTGTLNINSNTTYTAYCVRGGTCQSSGTNVSVTVNNCTPPSAPTLSASPTTVALGGTSTLTATGCSSPNIVTWSNGLGTGSSKTVTPSTTTTYTATCGQGTCQSGNGSVMVTVSAGCTPPSAPTLTASPSTINVGQSTTLTASGCSSPNTITWSNGSTGTTLTVSPTSAITYTATCGQGTCQSGNGSVTVVANVSISVTSALQNSNPRTRKFTFRLPSATPACNRPMLIVLHGDGGSGGGVMSTTGFNDIADANNFIAVYPNAETVGGSLQWNKYADAVAGFHGYGPDLNAPDDEKFISDLIDYFHVNYGIDRSKVYVTGYSGGGFMAYALTLSNQTKNKIAAIAPVAANVWADGTYATTQLASGTFVPTPILHVHSTTDGTVSFPNLSGWTWTGRIAEATCGTGNNGTHTTTAISTVIDKHTFCNGTSPVIMMGLKQAGLGHGWPTTANSTYNAAQEIWNFCNTYTKGTYSTVPTISPTSVTINSGQSTNLTASGCGTLNYLWSSGQTTATISVSPTSTSNYTVTCRSAVTNCQVGSVSNTAAVTVSSGCTPPSAPTLTASPSTINVGESTTLTASGCSSPNTVTWSNGSTGTTLTISPTSTTTYTATCGQGTCQSGNGSVTVTVTINQLNSLPPSALVGYLHNWDDIGGGLPYVQLDNVPAAYNVINYSFGLAQAGTTDNIVLTLPSNVDANPATRTQTFIKKMNNVQKQGRKVLLSLGGAVNSGGVINVGTITKRDNFIMSVTELLKTYPFDGLDIDIEAGSASNNTSTFIFNQSGMTVANPNSPTIDNFIYAIKQIMINYRTIRGKKMLLTMAPERGMIAGGLSTFSYNNYETSASYLPIIEALRDSLDLVHTQLYGYGSDLGKNGTEYCAGTMANALAVTEDLMLGFTLVQSQGTFSGLPANKIALGFPTPCQAASNGFLTTSQISTVVQHFRNTVGTPAAESPTSCNWMGNPQAVYNKISTSAVEFKGLMSWSINYDMSASCGNNSFASTYLSLYPAFTVAATTKDFTSFTFPGQVGATVFDNTNYTVTITMPAGTNKTNLVPTFALSSANCSTAKASGIARDFTNPVQYTVNHTDNSSTTWTVIVNLATSSNTHSITSCSNLTPSQSLFRVGTTGTNSIQVYLNIITAGSSVTLTASGPNFTGTATQSFTSAGSNQFMWVPINYDGGGTAGNRTITITSSEAGVATCSNVVTVFNPPIFSFTNCYDGTVSGTFVAGTASTGSLTVEISVTQAGPVTITLEEFGNSRMSGTYTGNVTMGQTQITIPINYDGTGIVGDGGQFTLYSIQAQGLGTTAGSCYGPMYILEAASSPCPPTIAINGTVNPPPYTNNKEFKASDKIYVGIHPQSPTATALNISSLNSNKLYLKAGKAIEIEKGTTIGGGNTVFEAKIEGCTSTQAPTMYMQGRHLYDWNNQQVILRGVNYPVADDWGFPAADLITEIEKSGSNTVRLQWYKNYHNNATRNAQLTNTALDNLLTKCKNNSMIPILELHDLTCASDANLLNTQLISWWTDPARVAILNSHKKYLIINLANELGHYRWQSYSSTALNNWKNAYKTAITSIRNAGLLMPIMIDAPDCGTDVKAIVDAGQEIITHDPQHNIIFSVHAYWAGYNGNTDLTNAINANLPIVFGEIANKQDELVGGANQFCYYNIDGTTDAPNNPTNGFQYQTLLTTLKNNSIGWLAWAWVRDQCGARNMTNNNPNAPYGQYNTLTTFGNNVVNNTVYGIKNTAVRSNAF
jgi:chitinase/poly(3-hydroxybutyrate) depolymerase